MQKYVQHFFRDDSGAVTVDWVVLAAATVGISIAAVGSVRSGVGSLGAEIQTALGAASVAMDCGGGAYEARVLTGDRARDAESVREQLAGMGDEQIRAGYAEAVEKAGILRDAGESDDYVNEVLDYAALYGDELASRRMTDEENSAAFDALAGTGGTACSGTDGAGEAGGYDLMAMGDIDDGRLADSFREEIHGYDSDQLMRLFGESETTYYEALAVGDDEKARIMLDQMYLASQEMAGRDDMERNMPSFDDHFQQAVDAYRPHQR